MEANSWVKLMVAGLLAMTNRLYLFPFCSFCSPPNYLVCLHHLDSGASLALAVTTSLLRTIGIVLC
jgi:hypothetical protein